MATRDEAFARKLYLAAAEVTTLRHQVEAFEQNADREGAELHAVLYGKIADALTGAQEALSEAADLADPQRTSVEDLDATESAHVSGDEPVMIVLRDPDFDNDYLPFTEGFAPVRDIDVDFGRMDLRDEGEFTDWAEGHLDQAKQLIEAGGRNRVAAGERLRQIVTETAENHGHTLDVGAAS